MKYRKISVSVAAGDANVGRDAAPEVLAPLPRNGG